MELTHTDQTQSQLLADQDVPEFAQSWRPYANKEMIFKPVKTPNGSALFIIDPWTQRWIIAQEPVQSLLRLADGRRQLSEIVADLETRVDLHLPRQGIPRLAQKLRSVGLLFDNQLQHKSAGTAVYNKCEPTGVHLEITNACNMTCTHCYVSSGKKMANEMTLDEVYGVIDMLPPFTGRRIAISGGEPVVRKDCVDIVEYCLKCGHDVDLYTNGRKFPRKFAERIIDLNATYQAQVRLQLSLEGASEETHEMVRGKGSFQDAMSTLEMFQALGLNRSVVLFVCVTRHNVREIDDLIALAERFDVSVLAFSQWQKQGNASNTPWASIAPTTEEWVHIGEKLLRYRNPRLVVTGNFFGDLRHEASRGFCLDNPLFPKHLYYYNAFPRITPDGQIFADQLWVDPAWALGNVRSDQMDDCFQSAKFYEQLKQMDKRTEKIRECQTCEWRRLCEGGSPGHTYAEYGHMDKKDLFCESRIYWFNRYVDHQVAKAFVSTANDA